MAWRQGPAGVGEQGMRAWGRPGTWEAPPPPDSGGAKDLSLSWNRQARQAEAKRGRRGVGACP